MKTLIIDNRMRKIEKEKLKELGYELIEIKENKNIYKEISSHVDIFVCKIGDKIIVEPSQYKYMVNKIKNIEKGKEYIGGKYPYDIKYNVCIIGNKAIHNYQYTDLKIKQELLLKNYQIINTSQGYTNCSVAVINDNSAIVTDKGLYKILEKNNIDVLYLQHEPDIKLLNEKGYSNKKGFIGGAISKVEDNILVFGDLNKIDKDGQIRNFISDKGLNLIDFKGLDVIDYGGIV